MNLRNCESAKLRNFFLNMGRVRGSTECYSYPQTKIPWNDSDKKTANNKIVDKLVDITCKHEVMHVLILDTCKLHTTRLLLQRTNCFLDLIIVERDEMEYCKILAAVRKLEKSSKNSICSISVVHSDVWEYLARCKHLHAAWLDLTGSITSQQACALTTYPCFQTLEFLALTVCGRVAFRCCSRSRSQKSVSNHEKLVHSLLYEWPEFAMWLDFGYKAYNYGTMMYAMGFIRGARDNVVTQFSLRKPPVLCKLVDDQGYALMKYEYCGYLHPEYVRVEDALELSVCC